MRGLIAVTAIFAATWLAPAAHAAIGDFQRCDGYGAPNKNGDGMTKEASGFLGIFVPEPGRGTTRAASVTFSQEGIAACDLALADARLIPEYWMRTANLRRARAMHQLGAGNAREALADLDRADALAGGTADLLYRRSAAVGNKLLRSYALLQAGDKKGAAALAAQIPAERPYSRHLVYVPAAISLEATGDRDAYRQAVIRATSLFPELQIELLRTEFVAGNFAQVVKIRPQIELAMPRGGDGFYSDGEIDAAARNMAIDAQLDAMTAFSAAAVGQADAAATMISDRRAQIAKLTAAPPPRPDGRPAKKSAVRAQMAFVAQQGEATAVLDQAEHMIALLQIAGTGDIAKFEQALTKGKVSPDGAGIAIFQMLAKHAPQARRELDNAIGAIRVRMAAENVRPPLTLTEVFDQLPETETAARIPGYKGAKNFLGENTGNGFIVRTPVPDEAMINFGGYRSSAAVVEEMALLRAADLAKAAGRKGMIVKTRYVYQRTIVHVGMYSGGRQEVAGYSADIAVKFVDLPASAPVAGDSRPLDVERVYADLSPIYVRPAE